VTLNIFVSLQSNRLINYESKFETNSMLNRKPALKL